VKKEIGDGSNMAMKKGSPAAKAWGRKMKRLRSGTASPKKKSSTTKYKPKGTMAKHRYTRKPARRTSNRSVSIMGINMGKATAAMLYGAIRAKTSNLIAPYTSKLPLGNIGDEVGMIVASVAAKKYLFKKAGVLRDALNAGQTIELARIGDAAASGDLNLPFLNMGKTAAPSSSGNIF